jgi:hypothetical protein
VIVPGVTDHIVVALPVHLRPLQQLQQIRQNKRKIVRQLLATVADAGVPIAGALIGTLLLNSVALDDANANAIQPSPSEAPVPATANADDAAVHQPEVIIDVPASVPARSAGEITQAREYLVGTASPGYTMERQGPALAIERLHPEFAARLADAIRHARAEGLSAGIFSAYRPPAFGVGGFADKFNSLHSYGLAVDMYGIGGPGSDEARRWHDIAARHGVVCPYGYLNQVEWNHCQPTGLKIVLPGNPLRETINGDGPLTLERMFAAGDVVIANAAGVDEANAAGASAVAVATERRRGGVSAERVSLHAAAVNERSKRGSRLAELASVKSARTSPRKGAAKSREDDDDDDDEPRRKVRHRSVSAAGKGRSTS